MNDGNDSGVGRTSINEMLSTVTEHERRLDKLDRHAHPDLVLRRRRPASTLCVSRRYYHGTITLPSGAFHDVDFTTLSETDAAGTGLTKQAGGINIVTGQQVTWNGSIDFPGVAGNVLDVELSDNDTAFINQWQRTDSNQVRMLLGGGYWFPAGDLFYISLRQQSGADMNVAFKLGIDGIEIPLCT